MEVFSRGDDHRHGADGGGRNAARSWILRGCARPMRRAGVARPIRPACRRHAPLGLDLPGSDIDVLCFAPDVHKFAEAVWRSFSDASRFTAKQWVAPPRPVVASFEAAGWRIELYGEAIPVEQQRGWRHFAVERRLLAFGGDGFRVAVLALRQRGMKTEPAFATALGRRG